MSDVTKFQEQMRAITKVINSPAIREVQRQMIETQRVVDELDLRGVQRQMRGVQNAVNEPSVQRALEQYQTMAQRLAAARPPSELVRRQRNLARVAADLDPVRRELQQLFASDTSAYLGGLPEATPSLSPSTPDPNVEPTEPAPLAPPEPRKGNESWVAEEFFVTLFLEIRYGHQELIGEHIHPREAVDLSTGELFGWGMWCIGTSSEVSDPWLTNGLLAIGVAFLRAGWASRGSSDH